jgi:hypothetical protein
MRQQNMYLYQEIEHQRAQIMSLTSTITQRSAEWADQRVAALDAQQATEDLRQSVQRSLSWRLTKPLRAVARLLNSNLHRNET